MKLSLARYRLPMVRPFRTAGRVFSERHGWMVRIESAGGSGYGEVAPLPGFGPEPASAVRIERALAEVAERLAGRPIPACAEDARALMRELSAGVDIPPAVAAGVETALSDLSARTAGLPLARWLNPGAKATVAANATIGAVSPDDAGEAARRALALGFRAIKVKVGDREASDDLPRLRAVRGALAGADDVELRADANGAWDEETARERLRAMSSLGLAYIEQPVPADEIGGLGRLRAGGWVRIAADESMLVSGGARRVIEEELADVVILKPALLGGPLAALALARSAHRRGIEVVVTTALDAAVGRAMAVHVAAALPGDPPACGLATGDLFADDVADGPAVSGGRIALWGADAEGAPPAGLGIVWGRELSWRSPGELIREREVVP